MFNCDDLLGITVRLLPSLIERDKGHIHESIELALLVQL